MEVLWKVLFFVLEDWVEERLSLEIDFEDVHHRKLLSLSQKLQNYIILYYISEGVIWEGEEKFMEKLILDLFERQWNHWLPSMLSGLCYILSKSWWDSLDNEGYVKRFPLISSLLQKRKRDTAVRVLVPKLFSSFWREWNSRSFKAKGKTLEQLKSDFWIFCCRERMSIIQLIIGPINGFF